MKPLVNDSTGRLLPGDSGIPPLEPGDRLTRDEFERRYEAMPHLKKAELIEGVVFIERSVNPCHGDAHGVLATCMTRYKTATRGVRGGDRIAARLDIDNEPQPDAMLFIEPARGGQVRVSDDDYVEGAPELVAEIASSSVSFDLHTKMHVYRRSGVKEYIVWRVLDRAIDWFVLDAGTYQPLTADVDGLLKSRVFPGLWLDGEALLRGDLARALARLQDGLSTVEHQQFVDRPAASK